MGKVNGFLKKLGPGLLFAGTAIGVSHLVQSTKAGAEFGFGLTWALFIAIILKYPFFKYAPKYIKTIQDFMNLKCSKKALNFYGKKFPFFFTAKICLSLFNVALYL